jgi:hypothetical protein
MLRIASARFRRARFVGATIARRRFVCAGLARPLRDGGVECFDGRGDFVLARHAAGHAGWRLGRILGARTERSGGQDE